MRGDRGVCQRAAWMIGLSIVFGIGGCQEESQITKETYSDTTASSNLASPPTAAIPSAAPVASHESKSTPSQDPLHRPFKEACTTEVNADSGVALPPVYTMTGKNTGSLNEAVQQIWDQIRFVDERGQSQTYVLELEIAVGERHMGSVEILMQPEWAPNHVRNFVALAKVGYYDGLRVDRVVREKSEEVSGGELVVVEAGSPVEDANPAVSHLGYWLLPEFQSNVKHEIGIVGACLMPSEDNAETAACRFYIALSAAPAMDGNFTVFGRVTKGLDIVRQISELPTISKDPGPDQGRFVQPVVIRKAMARPMPLVK